ncbi:ABC-type uncharacterized transport system permease subunit [Enterococcus rivorum]|nr:ABC-type uncharacterized transport system permease subunit [Enterococcus rivorum]
MDNNKKSRIVILLFILLVIFVFLTTYKMNNLAPLIFYLFIVILSYIIGKFSNK